MAPSLNFRQAAYAQETERALIALITITHEEIKDPIRISTDPSERLSTPLDDIVYGTVSRGNKYIFLPVTLQLPSDTVDGPGQMSIQFDNIHRSYTEAIRSISTPASFNVELVLDNDPDTVEAHWPEFLLTNITYDALTITGKLSIETLERESFPSGTFSPNYFPGLFR